MDNGRAFETATRIGFAARGLMYVLIGWLALRFGRSEDPAGVIDWLAGHSGRLILAAMAAGFLAYGAWRLLDAWSDPERRGSDAKGIALRLAGACSGLVHLALGAAAGLRAAGGRSSAGGSQQEDAAAAALDLPGGWMVLILVAAALAVAAAAQLAKAWKLDFVRRLAVTASNRRWIGWLGRLGLAARGGVFAAAALLFWHAAMKERAQEAGGLADALRSLPNSLETAIAAGLILFGLFSLAEARYRRIDSPIA